MRENYDDICRWVGRITLGKCIGCSRIPHFENKDKLCRLCLLDAMKRKLAKISMPFTVFYRASDTHKWNVDIDFGAWQDGGTSELAALAGAVRQMLKEEKR